MAPKKNEEELYFQHTMDAVWIITLWHWIHGGDPMQDTEAAQTTELLARGLVGHMGRGREESGDIVEKLNQFGIKLTIRSAAGEKEVKTMQEAYALYKQG